MEIRMDAIDPPDVSDIRDVSASAIPIPAWELAGLMTRYRAKPDTKENIVRQMIRAAVAALAREFDLARLVGPDGIQFLTELKAIEAHITVFKGIQFRLDAPSRAADPNGKPYVLINVTQEAAAYSIRMYADEIQIHNMPGQQSLSIPRHSSVANETHLSSGIENLLYKAYLEQHIAPEDYFETMLKDVMAPDDPRGNWILSVTGRIIHSARDVWDTKRRTSAEAAIVGSGEAKAELHNG
jgi:hypothetical protein